MSMSSLLWDKRPLPLPVQRICGPLTKNKRCLGLFLLELRRHRESLLRRPSNEGHSQREITDFFKIQTQSSDKQVSHQAPEFTGNTRGVLISRATELGRSRRPQLQKSSKYRWRIHQKVRTIVARHGRKPVRVLTAEDVEEICHQLMLGFLGPLNSRFGSRFYIPSYS